jgi:hypothetical protein
MARLEQLADEWPTHIPLIDTMRAQYAHRASHLGTPPPGANGAQPAAPGPDGGTVAEPVDQELLEHYLIRRAVIDAERAAVLDLREHGAINDETWHQIERELDLEELRMDA